MNALDIIVLTFLGLLVFNGIRKGFIISLASLIGLILGIYVAVHFSNYTVSFLKEHFHANGSWVPVLSFSITFLAVLILVILIAKVVEKMVSLVGMSILNHILGGVFGLVKGIIIVSVILYIICSIDKKEKLITPKVKKESFVYQYVGKAFPLMIDKLGTEIKFTTNSH